MVKRSRTLGIRTIGWAIIFSNALLILFLYILPANRFDPLIRKLIVHISTVAIFPLDFFTSYLHDVYLAHYYWIMIMIFCAAGIMLLNKFARTVFIVFNIIHIVILTYIVIFQFHGPNFFDYFFRLYFNLVACGTCVGYLTIPDVRELFRYDLEKFKFHLKIFGTQIRKYTADDASSYYNLGAAYIRLERFSDAIEALQKAISINAQNADYHFQLGSVYLKQRKHDAAIRAFKEALILDPIHVQATQALAQSYREQGCESETIRTYERLSHINPQSFEAYRGMGVAYNSANRYQEAVDVLSKAVELNSKDDTAYYELGFAYFHLDQYKPAEEALSKAARLSSRNKKVYFQLGETYLKLNKPKEALRSFKQALQLDENDKHVHYQVGFTYALLKDFDSARREYHYLKQIDQDLASTLALVIQDH